MVAKFNSKAFILKKIPFFQPFCSRLPLKFVKSAICVSKEFDADCESVGKDINKK